MTVALPRVTARRRRAPSTAAAPRRRLVLSVPGVGTGTASLLFAIVAVLVLFGLVMVLSSSSLVALEETASTWSYATKQFAWALLGSVGMAVAVWTDRRLWRRYSRVFLVGVVALLVAVLLVGRSVNGAARWIGLGPLTVQPSELAKLAVILVVADLLTRRAREIHDPRRGLVPALAVVGGVCLLILVQPNLGTTLVIAAIALAMLLASGAPMKPVAVVGGAAAVVAAVAVWVTPYRRRRLFAMFDPWANAQGTGYQAIQANVGFADGGLTGLGLGQSRAKWGYLPFAHTDFVFAIIGEELGLIGALVTAGLFVALAFVGARAATYAADRFSMLVAVGITTWLVAQAFLNIGVVIGLVPNTGVPLPFVSYGGSSLLVTMVAAGMLLNIARHPRQVEGA